MKLRTISENTFPNGEQFYTGFPAAADPETPIMTQQQIQKLRVVYHASSSPNLHRTGIMTRQSLGKPDLWQQGTDTTHQDSVYLAVSPEVLQHIVPPGKAPHVYKIDLRGLDSSKFLGDEDAPGHCVLNSDDWVSSIMCMGTFRYVGDIPATLVTPDREAASL